MPPKASSTPKTAKEPKASKEPKEPKEPKPPKPAPKPAGADIRSFFNKGASQKSAGSSQGTAISIDEPDVKPAVSKLAAAATPTIKRKITSGPDVKASTPSAKNLTSTPTPVKRKNVVLSDDEEVDTPPKKKPAPAPSKPRAAPKTSNEDVKPIVKMEFDEPEPGPKPKPGRPRTSTARRVVDDSEEDDAPKKKPAPRKSATSRKKEDDDFIVDDDEEEEKPKKATKPRASTSKRVIDDEDDEDDEKPKKKAAAPRKSDAGDVPAKPRNNYAAVQAARAAGPSAPGSKPIPDGEPNCLAGLTLVFTGELSSMSRDEASDLAKRYGGRVTTSPSSKTSYVIVGDNAGPSKLAALKKHGIPTLDEDGFLTLIATRKGFVDEKTKEKMKEEARKLEEGVRELAQQQRQAEKAAAKASAAGGKRVFAPGDMLWTTKYAPTELKQICGNKPNVEKLATWLENWQAAMKSGFKKPGKDAMGVFRAVLISGPPGIGKTTTAHLVARLKGYTPLELNASDARSKKLIENGANISNRSLDGWLGGGGGEAETSAAGVQINDRTCLIMDEVDGMSAGDRGGVGALSALIKKTKIPIICIANDSRVQKLKPLLNVTFGMTFSKPSVQQVRSRIMTITRREGMNIPGNVVDQLISGAQSDIRQVLNMISTWKLSSDTMDFDESKMLTKLNEKYTVMTPFNIITKVLGPYMFSKTSRETLGDKMEYYFHDHSFVPLFMQENYVRSTPMSVHTMPHSAERDMKHIELLEKAARSLSESDLVDAMIHGNDQQWSLMPLHAALSTVRPAMFMAGQGAYWGGPKGIAFPAWLGNNSRENKLRRQLAEVQIKMRLQASGSKAEVRLGYLSALHRALVRPLAEEGSSAIPEVVDAMDSYYLGRDDWDTLVELGVGELEEKSTLKQISTATKSAFTRAYNTGDHPVAFHKQEFGKAPKKVGAAHGPAPDLEDVFDVDDDDDAVEDEPKADDDDDDIGKDKLIKQPKAAKGAAAKKAANTKAKK